MGMALHNWDKADALWKLQTSKRLDSLEDAIYSGMDDRWRASDMEEWAENTAARNPGWTPAPVKPHKSGLASE
jgi:hypothetical protein